MNDIEKWNGTSLLMQASFIGDLEMAKFLLSHNAAIDQADYYKQTPLMFAALKVCILIFLYVPFLLSCFVVVARLEESSLG